MDDPPAAVPVRNLARLALLLTAFIALTATFTSRGRRVRVGMLGQTSELGDWGPGRSASRLLEQNPWSRPEIYTVRPDGSQLTRLTDESKPSHGPAFSPSGDRIAFSAGGS